MITQVCLDICMEAPIIILPVSSRNPFTFEANLGKLTLVNDHRSTPHFAHTILTDVMTFKLSEMTLARLDHLNVNFGLGVGGPPVHDQALAPSQLSMTICPYSERLPP